MATLPSYFTDFLAEIRLTKTQIDECKTGHTTLRDRLHADEDLAPIIVESFLQGSYRRKTGIRPSADTSKSDVDVIVVTTMDKDTVTPRQALERFRPFLKKHYDGKFELQGRSWGIKLSYVELDLVPTSAPSEVVKEILESARMNANGGVGSDNDWGLDYFKAGRVYMPSSAGSVLCAANKEQDQWRKEPLLIPDRHAEKWVETHPLAQISATAEKNSVCNSHFVNVVKCIKWWRVTQKPEPKYPKSYPLEHLICLNCPSGIDSVAKGVVRSFEEIRDNYQSYAWLKRTPFVPDHGVPQHNVFGRVTGDDFAAFHALVSDAAALARKAYDEADARKSALLWRALFGDKFPEPPPESGNNGGGGSSGNGGYTPRKDVSIIGGGRFAGE